MFVGSEKGDVAAGFGHPVTLMKSHPEAGDGPVQQVGRDRGRTIGDIAQVGSSVPVSSRWASRACSIVGGQRAGRHTVGVDRIGEGVRPKRRYREHCRAGRMVHQHVVAGDVTHGGKGNR